jgi:hypothetical protein
MDPISRRLYDRGRADLESRFDAHLGLVRDPFQPDRHMPHHTLWYAYYLLADGDNDRADQIVDKVLSTQERRDGDPHLGNFRWHWEDEVVTDLNACQFVLEALTTLPLASLSDTARTGILDAMRLALAEAEALDVHWTYTNIHLLDIRNRILGGHILGDTDTVCRGAERLRKWARLTKEVGAPHEFNSATYAAVDLNCLAAIAERAGDTDTRRLGQEMEEFVWRHIAKYWHAPTMQLGGPHSRSYRRDVAGASGYLKTVLYKLLGDERLLAETPYYDGPDSEGELVVAVTEYHCPPDAEEMLRTPARRTVVERAANSPDLHLISTVTPRFALGTMTRPYGVGDPPEPWPANDSCMAYWSRDKSPGYGVLYCRYRVNAGPIGQPSRVKVPPWMDIWEEGVFRTSQAQGTAIVAYGLMPRGQRLIESLRLDVRMLGPSPQDVLLDGGPWDGAPMEVISGSPVIVCDGHALTGVIPLTPTYLGRGSSVTLWRDGEETVLSIGNYQGPPKVFWEYRSLSGPFWNGNVKNGFVLWMADRDAWPSVEDFEKAVHSTPLRDEQHGSKRHIEFGDLSLHYDLRSMWP